MNHRQNKGRLGWMALLLVALAGQAASNPSLLSYSNNLQRAETHLFAARNQQAAQGLPQAWTEIDGFRRELKQADKLRSTLDHAPATHDADAIASYWRTFGSLTNWHDKLAAQDAGVARLPATGTAMPTTVAPLPSDPVGPSLPSPSGPGLQPSTSGNGAVTSPGTPPATGPGPGATGTTGTNPGSDPGSSTNGVPIFSAPAHGIGTGPGGSTNPPSIHPMPPRPRFGDVGGIPTNISPRSFHATGRPFSAPGIQRTPGPQKPSPPRK